MIINFYLLSPQIVITSNPPLPLLPSNVSYICLLENKQENISISVQLKENYTRCFVPSSLLSFENQSVGELIHFC